MSGRTIAIEIGASVELAVRMKSRRRPNIEGALPHIRACFGTLDAARSLDDPERRALDACRLSPRPRSVWRLRARSWRNPDGIRGVTSRPEGARLRFEYRGTVLESGSAGEIRSFSSARSPASSARSRLAPNGFDPKMPPSRQNRRARAKGSPYETACRYLTRTTGGD